MAEPVCCDCTVPAFPACPAWPDSPRPGQCTSCLLELRLRELLAGPDGGTCPSPRPLREALAATDPPGTALRWLARPRVAAVLSGIAAGGRDLCHGELDRLEQTPVLAHLRSVLVATGTLPARDELMARLERFTAEALDGRPDPDQRQILRRYATWHLLRRLRSRNNGRPVTREQQNAVQQQVRAAAALLDWLDARRLTRSPRCRCRCGSGRRRGSWASSPPLGGCPRWSGEGAGPAGPRAGPAHPQGPGLGALGSRRDLGRPAGPAAGWRVARAALHRARGL
jgi:hypothetical protein